LIDAPQDASCSLVDGLVVCLRSEGEDGKAHGHLFAPRVTRNAVMIDGPLKERAINAVRGALGGSSFDE
jgi:hypothetical protein